MDPWSFWQPCTPCSPPPAPRHVPQFPVTDDELLAVAVTMGVAHDPTPATAATAPAGERVSAPVPPLSRRPADVAGNHTLAVLADAHARHVLVVVSARTGRRPVDPPHAVAALALWHAVIADLHAEHRPIVRDGLAQTLGAPR
jgi:hypothetical protein